MKIKICIKLSKYGCPIIFAHVIRNWFSGPKRKSDFDLFKGLDGDLTFKDVKLDFIFRNSIRCNIRVLSISRYSRFFYCCWCFHNNSMWYLCFYKRTQSKFLCSKSIK